MIINNIVLASQSPHRRQLLASTGLSFTTAVAGVDEGAINAASPAALAEKRAAAKALAGAAGQPGSLVIGCDQVLEHAGKSFGKAANAAAAKARLREFSGHTHFLWSAFVLASAPSAAAPPEILHSETVKSSMPMRTLSEAELEAYIATGEWQGCAGCYRFENRGVHLFHPTSAEASAVIGLPLTPLLAALRQLGVHPLLNPCGPWQIELPR